MSIVIKGMSMPESCYRCPFRATVDAVFGAEYKTCLCKVGNFYLPDAGYDFLNERHPDCPLRDYEDGGVLNDRCNNINGRRN